MDKLKKKLKEKLNLNSTSGSSSIFSSKPAAFAGTGHKLGTSEPKAPPPPIPSNPASSSTVSRPSPNPVATDPSKRTTTANPSPPPSEQQQPPPLKDLSPAADESILSAIDQLSTDPHCTASSQIINRILSNIIANPTEEKYRKVRLNNPKIQSAVVDTHGGVELILACGFNIVFETIQDVQRDIEENESRTTTAAAVESVQKEQEEGFAILHIDADLEPLQAAVALLQQKWPARPAAPLAQQTTSSQPPLGVTTTTAPPPATTKTTSKEREWAPPLSDRKTQVILPASVDTDVPSWFFERTGQELKASFLAAVRKREQSQILMTKALREKLAKNGGVLPSSSAQQQQQQSLVSIPTVATVKVRLPEGLNLQGEFSAGEPVAAVFAWVADSLCDPLQTFDLVLPDRRLLEFNTKAAAISTGSSSSTTHATTATSTKFKSAAAIYSERAAERPSSIKEAGLIPSVTLNLRWTGSSAEEMKGVPALREELYTQAAA